MSVKYMYLHAGGGFNDILMGLYNALKFCEETDRVLLFDLAQTVYGVPFDRYFSWSDDKVITDKSVIEEILSRDLSVFPPQLTGRSHMIMDGSVRFGFTPDPVIEVRGREGIPEETIKYSAPDPSVQEDLIVHTRCGGGFNGVDMLYLFHFIKPLVDNALRNLSLLSSPYLFLHIRGTDFPGNDTVEEIISTHKDIIQSYEYVYLATDDINVIDAFDKEGILYKNFSTFPSRSDRNYRTLHKNYGTDKHIPWKPIALHRSSVDGSQQIKDIVSDLFLCANAGEFIQSVGGFSKLLSSVHKNQKFIDKFYT